MKKLFVLPIAAVFALTSCNQNPDDNDPNIQSFTNGVFVVHEGNFQGGNASLSFLNHFTDSMSNDVFTSVNTIPLGDVAQSMVKLGDKGYIVVNNSGKVEVVNLQDLSSAGTITGLSSPRYICMVSNSIAYVSDLFAGAITVFNPQTLATIGTIAVNGHVEEMVKTSSGVIAAGTGANQVYKINSLNNALNDSVNVGVGPSSLVTDVNGRVWVLTNGGWGTEEPKLVCIDPVNMTIELSLNFSLSEFPSCLKIDGEGNTLFWVNGGVYRMEITSTALPTTPFLNTAAYKVGYDAENDRIYVSDAGDFNSNGHVYRYGSDGTPIDTFEVGVIPAEFCIVD